MNNSDFRSREPGQNPAPPHHAEGRTHYVLKAEERILQLISSRAAIPEILNEVCTALDCQIGNIVSLISLPEDDEATAIEIAQSADLFGLHMFYSTAILAESGEEIGSLEMFCCVPRDPSHYESQLIDRAVCLAAIAIERNAEASGRGNHDAIGNRALQPVVRKRPASMN
jgi:hypothetical protein